MTKRTREWLVERIALGEIDESSATALTETERARLQEIRRENEGILATHSPPAVAEEVRRRLHVERVRAPQSRRRDWRWGVVIVAPLAAGVIAVVGISFDPTTRQNVVELEKTRVKGGRQLSIHRKTGGQSQILHDLDVIQLGDLVQLAYGAGREAHGLVLSIDGGGAVTLHLPQSENDTAIALDLSGAELPFSYELDDAPEFERFFLITADQPFVAGVVLQAARLLARDRESSKTALLALPPNFAQTTVLLRKAVAP